MAHSNWRCTASAADVSAADSHRESFRKLHWYRAVQYSTDADVVIASCNLRKDSDGESAALTSAALAVQRQLE